MTANENLEKDFSLEMQLCFFDTLYAQNWKKVEKKYKENATMNNFS